MESSRWYRSSRKRGPGRRGAVKITYDKDADALHIRLLEGVFEFRSVRLTDEIVLDFAAGERLVSIEVLGARRLFSTPESPVIDLEDLTSRTVIA